MDSRPPADREGVPEDRGDLAELKERRYRGGVWATAAAVGSSALGFVTFTLLSRILGPEIFGLMAMVEASLALGQTVIAGGLAEPLIQLRRLRAAHVDTLFWTMQVVGVGLVVLMILLRDVAERFFRQEGLAELVLVTSFILYLRATEAVPRALLVRDMRFDSVAKARISGDALGGAVGLAAALTGRGVWSLVAMRLVAVGVELLVTWRQAAWLPRLRWSLSGFRDLWRFSLSRGLDTSTRFFDNQIPRFILGRFVGAEELGYFVFARRLIQAVATTLVSPVRAVAMPTFARLQEHPEEVRNTYRSGTALTAAVMLPLFATAAVGAPALVPLVVGERWLPSVLLIQVLALGAFRRTYNLWNGATLRGLGRPELLLYSSFLRSSVTLSLIFLLLPYGAVGLCAAIVAGTYVSWPVAMHFVRKLTDLGAIEQLRQMMPAAGATAILVAAELLVREMAMPHLAAWLGAGLLLLAGLAGYVAGLAWFGRAELNGLIGLIRDLKLMRKRASPS